ncbi:curli production assembly/transport protein CsgG [Sansalvadorimonas sp. 2012CJ34-2]|uniref:Curli production assembly/transport component CsgG n=1 Tax=Parendozoicomonas callyspongiae TaxID=2942213 RepID=A0ABT0PAZ0_9GAMM|nr:CsgG/HfaB family protein [Sansalvadorimonas sp. 2012CJ34-2]MCL6268545.1 curli production assembly/transport protein CsgG [Sansalvadorimonas sp. 2012CJ34-2]
MLFIAALISGCAGNPVTGKPLGGKKPTLMPRSSTFQDLKALPKPAGKIIAAVYGFQDQTGQYRPAPASNFSTAVTQGATAMLNTALKDSGWFIPLEREGLQNVLTERKIIRAANKEREVQNANLPPLSSASVLLEGGIIAYESNTRTGGVGAKYFGIGFSGKYRQDQVTINLRAVDIYSGQILHSVNVTKTILSHELQAGIYRFIEYKRLLETEGGYTNNEPVQMLVMSAIEAAVIHMITEGIQDNSWRLGKPEDMNNPVIQAYMQEASPSL